MTDRWLDQRQLFFLTMGAIFIPLALVLLGLALFLPNRSSRSPLTDASTVGQFHAAPHEQRLEYLSTFLRANLEARQATGNVAAAASELESLLASQNVTAPLGRTVTEVANVYRERLNRLLSGARPD